MPTSCEVYRLLMTFADSLDPDQDRQNDIVSVLILVQTVNKGCQSPLARKELKLVLSLYSKHHYLMGGSMFLGNVHIIGLIPV